MSPRGRAIYTTGDYGSTVSVIDTGSGSLLLRFTQANGKPTDRSLRHRDERRAKQQARDLSRDLAARRATDSGLSGATSGILVRELFARYTTKVSVHKKGTGPSEDARRRTLWLAVLGPDRPARSVSHADVREFMARRSAGTIHVDGIALKAGVKPRTVEADIVYLLAVYNWAFNEAHLLRENPLRGAPTPQVVTQLRPMADPQRVPKLLAVADQVHPRFALMLTCVRWLGWRVSAVCRIDGFDIDRKRTELAPYGAIRKNWRNDKEGAGKWVPMPKPVREAFDAAQVVGEGWVFAAPTNPDKPMSRWYARDLLERAEALAQLDDIEGGDWHPYRRLWATERKPFPKKDVMLAGDWKDERSIDRYQLADPETLKQVMLYDPEMQSASAPGVKTGGRKPNNSRS